MIKVEDERNDQKDGEKSTPEIDMSGLNKAVVDALEDLESGHEVYGDGTVKEATLKCVEHLQDKRELSHKDLKMSIYLEFLENPMKDIGELTREDIWKIGKLGLDHLEKETDLVEVIKDEDDHIYRWKE
ncbi:MAG: hypothetical protein KGY66_03595 [Candidatus Thermoplasmatota archaeon]|nr:hypothetical protein [Candidatus Thermoplasmatota archaeon]MBS3789980.1 hypothetical protein [Candidatus Thermoplasmatota archaeon]